MGATIRKDEGRVGDVCSIGNEKRKRKEGKEYYGGGGSGGGADGAGAGGGGGSGGSSGGGGGEYMWVYFTEPPANAQLDHQPHV